MPYAILYHAAKLKLEAPICNVLFMKYTLKYNTFRRPSLVIAPY